MVTWQAGTVARSRVLGFPVNREKVTASGDGYPSRLEASKRVPEHGELIFRVRVYGGGNDKWDAGSYGADLGPVCLLP
ncbi:hypothetical protein E2562_004453 [Oryza meyeriana var. granulata]|uniref:Uncharacterized protein n=1 Tax=Oryza meyeriana var. granulata TaxID=110450 RepID=A0A6G1CYH4_9ORYZ|nr:hypothetical protein E2562_004453 [Oryza meyeriana var. granulata]